MADQAVVENLSSINTASTRKRGAYSSRKDKSSNCRDSLTLDGKNSKYRRVHIVANLELAKGTSNVALIKEKEGN